MFATFREHSLLPEKQKRSHCMLLKKRLSYPDGYEDIVPLFGRKRTELCLVFELDFIYQRHHNWLKSYKFVEFTSQWKISLSFVERIYSVYGILENTKTCLCGYKADDVFETNPIPYILLLSRDENLRSIE